MISWIQLWPLVVIPYVVLFSLGLLPTFELFGQVWGGPVIREWALNQFVLPLLPNDAGWALVGWFGKAGTAQEIGLYALLSLNIYAVVFPLFYLLGHFIIRMSAWSASEDLNQKRQSLKR